MKYCRRLIVVPLSTFHRLAELIGDPKGELIFLFHTARCGSTLLTQVFHGIIPMLLIKTNPHNSKTYSLLKALTCISVTLLPAVLVSRNVGEANVYFHYTRNMGRCPT